MTYKLWNLLEAELGKEFWNASAIKKAVQDLSKKLTEEREQNLDTYLDTEAARRAYTAYFLPLNFHKNLTLLKNSNALSHLDPNTQKIQICDFGCGPATATLAFLEELASYKKTGKFQDTRVLVYLIDSHQKTLELAQKLVLKFAHDLKINIEVKTETTFIVKDFSNDYFDVTLASNVVNELSAPQKPEDDIILSLAQKTKGLFLLIEPGHRVPSQRLIRVRERILKLKNTDKIPTQILGPCTHLSTCPLYRSKHWCHFSEQVLDHKLIELNLAFFNSPREWLKFSYVLFSFHNDQPTYSNNEFRAIGDLHPSGPGMLAIDLCQPKEKFVLKLSVKAPAHLRKDLVRGSLCIQNSDQSWSVELNTTED